jgi:SAM-dependent methyltransferase
MHGSAMEYGKRFFELYARGAKGLKIVEIGALDINGSLRSVAPPDNTYLGLDTIDGKGVDIVVVDSYILPLKNNTVDICISSSCFEHAEFFWLCFNEVLRILKPEGIFYLNAPSNGAFHRHPVDCWRFYPDSGVALQNWGRRNGYPVVLLESFIGLQKGDTWNDFVAVFLKDRAYIDRYPERLLDRDREVMNGIRYGTDDFINLVSPSQDQEAHRKLTEIVRSIGNIMNS